MRLSSHTIREFAPMSDSAPRLPVVVTGDVFLDHLLYIGHDRSLNSNLDLGTEIKELSGGAGLMADLLKRFLEESGVPVLGPSAESRRRCPKAFGVFDWFPEDSKVSTENKVWRVRNVLGYESPKEEHVPPRLEGTDT